MRVIRVEAFEFHRPLDGAAWNPSWRWRERRAPLLRLTAKDGVTGLGEGWSDQTEIGAFFKAARIAAEGLLGGGPVAGAPDRGWAAAAAASAIDMAQWDMRARRAGAPLHRMLGASGSAVSVYASGGLYADGKDADGLAAEMQGYATRGFEAVKMKVGGLAMEADLHRVASVRAVLGPERALMVDAVERLTRDTASVWADALAGLGVWAIQAPLPGCDLDGMAALQARGPLAVVAQEREHRPEAFAALLDRRAVGLLQFCPGLAGGITGALWLIDQAQAAGVPVTLQCYSTAVMQAACFQLAAGRAAVHSAEFHQFHDHLYDWLPEAMCTVRHGRLHLDAAPGLGIDPALLDNPLPGSGTIRRVFRVPD